MKSPGTIFINELDRWQNEDKYLKFLYSRVYLFYFSWDYVFQILSTNSWDKLYKTFPKES